jgi:phosphopantetheinyl transferase (holo-ACP synthase)
MFFPPLIQSGRTELTLYVQLHGAAQKAAAAAGVKKVEVSISYTMSQAAAVAVAHMA